MKTLFQTKAINADGTAESEMRYVYEQLNFDQPTDILVQVHLSSMFINQQTNSYWNLGITVDSYEFEENGTKKTVNVPPFSAWNNLEISKCSWVKVRLEYQNGGCSGIINIFKESSLKLSLE